MRKQFTLIELLVVIAIIAILASMLLPSLQKAREAGYKISCANKMKTLGIMINMYINDNNAFLPPTSSGGAAWNFGGSPSAGIPAGSIAPYYKVPDYYFIGKSAEMTCPADKRQYDNVYFYKRPHSYGLNWTLCGQPGNADVDYGPHPLSRYKTRKIIAMENTGDSPASTSLYGLNPHQFQYYRYQTQQLTFHNNGCNKLWIDGAVSWSRPQNDNINDFNKN